MNNEYVLLLGYEMKSYSSYFLQTGSETEMRSGTQDVLITTELTQFRSDFWGELREKKLRQEIYGLFSLIKK